MMELSKVKGIAVPDGNVKQITNAAGVVLWRAGRLPPEYQEVEWIGTDGNSWFVSDFTINSLDKFTVHYTYATTGAYMFGADGPNGEGVNAPRFCHRHASLIINKDTTSGNFTLFGFLSDGAFHSYKIVCEHEGAVSAYKGGEYLTGNTFYNAKNYRPFGVFCNNYGLAPSSHKASSGSKLSELRFVDDTTGKDVFDPIPCYRKADGVIGMYDLVSGTFYTNEGTGSFTKGADV